MAKKVLLTISILISNRPDTVGKCLDSLNTLRKKVPSELILVDTGCGDAVRKIIEGYTDQIVEFKWCNDFAKARNAGLKKANGEWFLFLDDDEWFEDTKEIEDFFITGEYKKYNYGSYYVRNYSSLKGDIYSDTVGGRLIKLYPDVEFKYAVHETFTIVRGPAKRFNTFAHHYGYAYATREDAYRHAMRNIQLLQGEHERDPYDLRHNAQLAQEYNTMRDWDRSLAISYEGLEKFQPDTLNDRSLNALYGNIVRCYLAKRDYDAAISCGVEYLQSPYLNEFESAILHYSLGKAYLVKKDYQKAIDVIEAYLVCYGKWEKDHGIYSQYDGGCWGDCFTPETLNMTMAHAVQAAVGLGDVALTKKYFDRIDWDFVSKSMDLSQIEMVQALIERWLQTSAQEGTEWTKLLEFLTKNEVMFRVIVTYFEKMLADNSPLLYAPEADWNALETKGWIFLYLKIRNHTEQNEDILQEDYKRLWQETETAFVRSKELKLWDMARRDGISMEKLIFEQPMFKWEAAVRMAFRELTQDMIEYMDEKVQSFCEQEHYTVLTWKAYYYKNTIDAYEEKQDNFSSQDVMNALKKFSEDSLTLYRRIYKEEVFATEKYLLPKDCRIALEIQKMLQKTEESRYAEALSSVKELLIIAPEWVNTLKICSKWINEKSAQNALEQDMALHEMEKLAESVKAQIRTLIRNSRYQDAKMVLQQLKALCPMDLEIKRLEEELQKKIILK